MKHIKLFENWVNDPKVDSMIERALDIVIYYCLEALQVDGGNSVLSGKEVDWKEENSIFSDEGPDLWVNTELYQCEKEIDILRRLSYNQRFKEVFKENRLEISDLSVDETIITIILPELQMNSGTRGNDSFDKELNKKRMAKIDAVVDFYTNFKPKRMQEIKEKWKTYFVSSKFGL
jgi:hypothetical protein